MRAAKWLKKQGRRSLTGLVQITLDPAGGNLRLRRPLREEAAPAW